MVVKIVPSDWREKKIPKVTIGLAIKWLRILSLDDI